MISVFAARQQAASELPGKEQPAATADNRFFNCGAASQPATHSFAPSTARQMSVITFIAT
jgi:hypothetical protein